jgi:GNAT superfamily N-acetyltransferase
MTCAAPAAQRFQDALQDGCELPIPPRSFRSSLSLQNVSMFVESLTVDEFTIGQIRTPQELDHACRFLLRIFPSQKPGGPGPGPGLLRDRLAEQSPMMLTAKREEEIAGVVLGHVEGGGLGTVDQLAVAAALRGIGLGRRLLAALESGARSLGVRQLTLGSVDGAVGFYERCGYQGRLLLQFTPPARRDEVAPLFADFALVQALWQDVPQRWVQTPEVDFTLTDRVSGRGGVHAQWAMDKNLADHLGKSSANRN